MNPAQQLKKLLRPGSNDTTGVVVEVSGTVLKVRTATGVLTAQANGAYKVGDNVLLRAGVVQGLVKPTADIPTYFV